MVICSSIFFVISDWMSSKSKYTFSATRSGGVYIYSRQTLIFDQVHNNIGNTYNPTFGHFTVPVNGTYLIGITLVTYTGVNLSMYLMKDTTQVYHFYFGDNNNGYREAESVNLALTLSKGDVLYVQGRGSPDKVEAGSTFTGVFLHT